MSIFTIRLSNIDTSDLVELLQERAVENLRLEFKREIPSKDEMVKKLSSFANTFGGFLVVGASADSNDGRINDLQGVEESSGFKQKIVDWCFKECSPPIAVDVSAPIPTPVGNGRVCYVIAVEESDIAPHFINGRKGVWIRTNEFSGKYDMALADEIELRHLLHRREFTVERRLSIVDRAKKRFATYLSKAKQKSVVPDSALLELCVVPRFPARQVCNGEELSKIVRGIRYPSYRGVGFPRELNTSVMTHHESVIVRRPITDVSIFEANVWGLLYYVAELEEKSYTEKLSGIHLYAFVGHLLVFLQHGNEVFRRTGMSGSILVEASLSSIIERQWVHAEAVAPGYPSFGVNRPMSLLDDAFGISLSTTVENLREEPDEIAAELLRQILFALNWSDLVDSEAKLKVLLDQGRTFNGRIS